MISIFNQSKQKTLSLIALSSLFLVACGSDNDLEVEPPTPPPPVAMAKFEVNVTNITNDQPYSPIAVISHDDSYSAFTIGESATAGLELLAEGGDNSSFIQEASDHSGSNIQSSGSAPVGPGGSDTIEIEMPASEANLLSVISMLVNTNDAITGRVNINVSELASGESISLRGVAYDAGTERNTEAVGTIPGPADGGEGFNAARDDLADQVTMHPGVVSVDDGLTTSILTEAHRIDNTVILIRVTRTE